MPRDRLISKRARRAPPKKGPHGYFICKQCKTKECLPPRITYCSERCVHDWKMRSDITYTKRFVEARDGTTCYICGEDFDKKRSELLDLRRTNRLKFLRVLHEEKFTEKMFDDRNSMCEMDHVIPVHKGGGIHMAKGYEDNLKLACRKCHMEKTVLEASQRARNRRRRRK
jgi:hypothetical protein